MLYQCLLLKFIVRLLPVQLDYPEAGGINLIYLDHGKLVLGIFCWIGVRLIILLLIGFSILNLDGNLRLEHLNLVFNTFY